MRLTFLSGHGLDFLVRIPFCYFLFLSDSLNKFFLSTLSGHCQLCRSCSYLLSQNVTVDKIGDSYTGRNFYYGIREHAMGSILNGIAYFGLHRCSGSTFLVFADYMRAPMRVAALSELPVNYILTHDSIGVGEVSKPQFSRSVVVNELAGEECSEPF